MLKTTKLAIALMATGLLASCDDDNNNSNEATGMSTGQFVDAPVAGLNYQTDSQSGTTNANGEFNYVEGESVTFSIGDITFPSVSADSQITPFDVADDDTNIALNIARLVQSLDTDSDPNTITIPSFTSAPAALDLSAEPAAFETAFGTNFPDESLISVTDAVNHMEAQFELLNIELTDINQLRIDFNELIDSVEDETGDPVVIPDGVQTGTLRITGTFALSGINTSIPEVVVENTPIPSSDNFTDIEQSVQQSFGATGTVSVMLISDSASELVFTVAFSGTSGGLAVEYDLTYTYEKI